MTPSRLCRDWLYASHSDSILDKPGHSILAGDIAMRMQYSADADILILILKETAPTNAIAEPGGVIVSYDETG